MTEQSSPGGTTPRTPRCAARAALIADTAIVSGPPRPHGEPSPGGATPRTPGPRAPRPGRGPALRRWRKGGGWAFLALVGVACCLGASGCAQFNKALGQQQATIYFTQNTPVAFKMKVRAACDNLPHVKATPIATGVPLASAVDVVTYNTTGAGVADIARLEECVNKYSPQVEGVDVTDSSDDS